jgi:hypothetical protein
MLCMHQITYHVLLNLCCCLQDAVRALLPGQLEAQPELLDQLGTMLHPRSLRQAGVAVYAALQVSATNRYCSVYKCTFQTGACATGLCFPSSKDCCCLLFLLLQSCFTSAAGLVCRCCRSPASSSSPFFTPQQLCCSAVLLLLLLFSSHIAAAGAWAVHHHISVGHHRCL